eukprot:scaffold129649_cov21-Tisochrysis_lutea.AAC.1
MEVFDFLPYQETTHLKSVREESSSSCRPSVLRNRRAGCRAQHGGLPHAHMCLNSMQERDTAVAVDQAQLQGRLPDAPWRLTSCTHVSCFQAGKGHSSGCRPGTAAGQDAGRPMAAYLMHPCVLFPRRKGTQQWLWSRCPAPPQGRMPDGG